MLVAEQKARIEVLEIQLQEERLQYDMQIQRLQLAHRTEIASMTSSMIKNTSNTMDASRLDSALRMQSFISTPQGDQSYVATGTGSEFPMRSSMFPPANGVNRFSGDDGNNNVSDSREFVNGYYSTLAAGGGRDSAGTGAGTNIPTDVATSKVPLVHDPNSYSSLGLGRQAGAAPAGNVFVATRGHEDFAEQTMTPAHQAHNAMDTTAGGVPKSPMLESFLDQTESDDAFLSYLDKFQHELKSIRAMSPPRLKLAHKK
jgi:hypothetical protein